MWELLRMYTAVVNYKLKKRGKLPMKQISILGAICSRFLLAMQERIIRDYKAVLVLQEIERAGNRIDPAIRASVAASIPDLSGDGARGRDSGEDSSNEPKVTRPIRWNSRGPSPITSRLQPVSGKVRSRSNAALTTTGVWEHIYRATEPERALGIELCGARLSDTPRRQTTSTGAASGKTGRR